MSSSCLMLNTSTSFDNELQFPFSCHDDISDFQTTLFYVTAELDRSI